MILATESFPSSERLGLYPMKWKAIRDNFYKQMIKNKTKHNLVCQSGRDDGHGLKCAGLGRQSRCVRVMGSTKRKRSMLASLHQRTNGVLCFWE